MLPVNLKLPDEGPESIARKLYRRLEALKKRAPESERPHVNLSNLIRLAVEAGLVVFLKVSDEELLNQMRINGLRRGRHGGR